MPPTDRYAVFGYPIKHSKSPTIHRLFAEQTGQSLSYEAQEVSAVAFPVSAQEFFAAGGKGLNCTVPLKELAFRFAGHLTERALLSKAVNTLALQMDGSLLGDNTDGCGLLRDLTANHKIPLTGTRILVLGAGGASRGIIGPLLEQSPAEFVIANRTAEKAVLLAEEFASLGKIVGCGFNVLKGREFDLILNATSASLSGELPPLPTTLLADNGNCYDLAYGDSPTAFVRWGAEQGASHSLDGLGMLIEQAAEAFFVWRGVRPNTAPIFEWFNRQKGHAKP